MSIDPEKRKKVEKLLKQKTFADNPTKAIWDELLSISDKLDVIMNGKEDN